LALKCRKGVILSKYFCSGKAFFDCDTVFYFVRKTDASCS
jgi:hypothetical protein